jgi:hypothetical protein
MDSNPWFNVGMDMTEEEARNVSIDLAQRLKKNEITLDEMAQVIDSFLLKQNERDIQAGS